jgi:uncharacterized protein
VVSAYPRFEALGIEHKGLLDELFKCYPPEISEFTFTNLYSWRHTYGFSLSLLEDFIILKSGLKDKSGFFDPIGTGDKKKAVSAVLNDFDSAFIRIPESAKALFDEETRFKIFPDRDNSDYLYKISDLVSLEGRKYDGKRNLIKKFAANNKYDYAELKGSDTEDALEFENRWCLLKNCGSTEGLANERRAVREMLKNFSLFNLTGGVIKIKGKMLAIALGERLNSSTLVTHALKADPDIPGLYQTLLREFLLRRKDEFEYVNLEQDMGIDGLRKAKQSYHPVKMVDKYIIRPAIAA